MNDARGKNAGMPNSLQVYLREIKDESLLTAAEECALAHAIARGDRDARTRMIQANLRLVVKIAREYVGRGMVFEDLIGEGNLGLIRAAEEFEPRFGTRFSTYASYWIKQSIRHALINTTSTIRLPAHMVGLLSRWRRAERALCREQGQTPSFTDVAALLGLSETQKSLVARASRARQVRLESSMAPEPGQWSPAEEWDQCGQPEAILEADDERLTLLRSMERLDPRERSILNWRYGLEGEAPLTLKEIGRRLGITREWVRKIELRAVRKLEDGWKSGRQGRSPQPRSGTSNRRARPMAVPEPEATSPVAGREDAKLRARCKPVPRPGRTAPAYPLTAPLGFERSTGF
ncbi:MAG: RNA polymerase sigma factor RpoD/SigA [Isosphaeraceae bacterium]